MTLWTIQSEQAWAALQETGVRLELEIPDGTALLSDFSLWHYPLNYWYLPSTGEDMGDQK
jgi:hypothetical protein